MITGAHSIIYSTNAEADRNFLRDVLKLPNVDVGHEERDDQCDDANRQSVNRQGIEKDVNVLGLLQIPKKRLQH